MAPSTGLPKETTALTVKLAEPVWPPGSRVPITEITFQWFMDEPTHRTYRGRELGEEMEVARYYAMTIPDLGFSIDVGLVSNTKSKFVKRAVELIAAAATRFIATMLVFGEDDPVHSGIGWPLNRELMEIGDGSIAPRGFAGIVRPLDTENVATTEVEFPVYFNIEGDGGES